MPYSRHSEPMVRSCGWLNLDAPCEVLEIANAEAGVGLEPGCWASASHSCFSDRRFTRMSEGLSAYEDPLRTCPVKLQ